MAQTAPSAAATARPGGPIRWLGWAAVEAAMLTAAAAALCAMLPSWTWSAALLAVWLAGRAALKRFAGDATFVRGAAGPIREEDLLEPLRAMAKAHTDLPVRFFWLRGPRWRARAAAAGVAAPGRIAVFLTEALPAVLNGEQRVAVVAHELGHALCGRHRWTWLSVAGMRAVTVGLLAALWLVLPAGPGAWGPRVAAGWALLWAATAGASLLRAALLRWEERRANDWAARATGRPGCLASAIEALARHNGGQADGWLARLAMPQPAARGEAKRLRGD